jgi:tight adherence protein B
MDILIGIGIFIVMVLLIEGGYFVFRSLQKPDKKRVRKRLRTISYEEYENEDIDIIRKKRLSEVPWLHRLLLRFRWMRKMDQLLEQAGTDSSLGVILLLTLLLALIGYLVGSYLIGNLLVAITLAAFLGMIPFLHVFREKKKRMEKFQRQLPDAMELIARALKAGHAFSAGVQMVCEEFDDPIGSEFSRAMDEINFGVSANEALKNLSLRIDCPDLKFFVISVIIQRETGGNLAEILENIGYLIRERFKLRGQIKALAAEGKLSALILSVLPFIVALIITVIAPGYVQILFKDPIGQVILISAILMMIMGIWIMKRIIEIKV